MTLLRVWLRLDLRRRWRSLLGLALLVAIAGATTMTAFAGARRGDSVIERLVARTEPADAAVLANTPGFNWAPIRRLPEVAAMSLFPVDYSLSIDNVSPETITFPPLDDQLTRTLEKPVIYSGRLYNPKSANEAMVTRRFVVTQHKGLGDTVTLHLPTPAQLRDGLDAAAGTKMLGPTVRLKIVGVVGSLWFADSPGSPGAIVTSPGLAVKYQRYIVGDPSHPSKLIFINSLVRLRGPDAMNRLRADVARITGRSDIDIMDIDAQIVQAQRTFAFEARCLAAFGLAAFIAALFLIGGAIARYAVGTTAELQTLRALGLTPRQAVTTAAAGPVLAGAVGGVLAAVIAVVASYWMPIGSASLDEPSPGFNADWVVLAPGVVLIVALVAAGAATAAWLALSASRRPASNRRSVVATYAARGGLPVPIVIGTRFALETGRGRTSVPVRPALIGAVVGTLGIVAAFTFSHAVSDASTNPERFGETFQLVGFVGINNQDFGPVNRLDQFLAGSKAVAGYADSRTAVATANHGRDSVSLYEHPNGAKSLPTVVLSGRMPRAADEVLLAPQSLSALGKHVGDEVSLAGSRGRSEFRVVGSGLVPQGSHNGYADGGWVTTAGYTALFTGFKFHIVLVDLTQSVRGAGATSTMNKAVAKFDPRLRGIFAPPDPLTEIASLKQVRVLPIALGAFLALLAVGAVGHALATAVRRRSHDLAVLRSLGMTRRQCRAVVVTQATVLALVGLIFGVPIGLAIGRGIWRVVADFTPLQYVPPLALAAMLLVGPAALVIANLLAAWPGHRAARLRVAQILRAE